MTAAVATPLPGLVSAVPPRAGTTDSSSAHARTSNFDSQLDAARQQHRREQQTQRPTHDDASTTARKDTAASPSAKSQSAKDKSSAATSATTTAPEPSSELAAGPTSPHLTAGPNTDEKTETSTPGKDDAAATAASSLVGAMLALLPTAAAVLQPDSGGTGTGGRAGMQGITMGGGDAQATPLLADDANVTLPADAARDLLAGKAMSPALAAGVLAALDTGRDPARDLHGISAQIAAPASPAPPSVLMLPVQAPVGSPAFGQELGQQVAWLGSQAGQGLKQASIRLHPEELGQLDIKVSVKHDRVDVVFSAQHPAAVTAVQQTLPQLNHLLAQHGLSLGHAEVGQQQHNDAPKDSKDSVRSIAGMADNEEVHASGAPLTVSRVGLLDAFA